MYVVCKYTNFFYTELGCHKKNMGDLEKLLTYLNSALKVLLGLDIFPRVPKKKLNCCERISKKGVWGLASRCAL